MAKILIVDDDADLLLVLHHALKGNGYNVETLTDPRQLMEQLATTVPDLIVLDINMGTWDGRDICNQVKSTADFAHIPVVLYSGLPESSNDTSRCEPDLFVQKPMSTSHFLAKIASLLKPLPLGAR